MAAPTYYNYNTPKVQAAAAVEASLPPPITGGTPAPGSITFNPESERIGQAQAEIFVVSIAGTYNVGVIIGAGQHGATGTFEIDVDGNDSGSVNVTDPNSGAYTTPIYLSAGQHIINAICAAEDVRPRLDRRDGHGHHRRVALLQHGARRFARHRNRDDVRNFPRQARARRAISGYRLYLVGHERSRPARRRPPSASTPATPPAAPPPRSTRPGPTSSLPA